MDTAEEAQHPWGIDEPEPTNLILAWPHESAPVQDEVLAALDQVVQTPLVREATELSAEGVEWVSILRPADGAAPLIVWAEAARTPMEGLDLGPQKWMVGFETVLDEADPLLAWVGLARVALAAFEVPAVLDVNASVWHPRAALERALFVEEGVEPASDLLWSVQVIAVAEDASAWVHTNGLLRCGLPELEMLAVPPELVGTAAALLGDVAARLLEEPVPEPGGILDVGPDVETLLLPWSAVAVRCPPSTPGAGADDRGEAGAGPRAVLVGMDESSTCPLEALEKLDAGAVVYRAARTTKRREALAQCTWNELYVAARLVPSGICSVIAQSAVGAPGGIDREHRWYAVLGDVDGEKEETIRVESIGIARDERTFLRARDLTDWCVVLGDGRFGPDEADELQQAIAMGVMAGMSASADDEEETT